MKGLPVAAKQCSTCIYRKDSPLNIKQLEAQVADKHMPGFFEKYRICHHGVETDGVCCRGFWNRHKDHFAAGQIAQRLNIVKFVEVE